MNNVIVAVKWHFFQEIGRGLVSFGFRLNVSTLKIVDVVLPYGIRIQND